MKKMRRSLFFIFVFFSVVVRGNEPLGNIYWIQFNSKANTPYSINQPEGFLSNKAILRREKMGIAIDSTDLPVNPEFIKSLQNLGFYVKHQSKWLNGAIAILPDSLVLDNITLPDFVAKIDLSKTGNLKSASNKFSDIDTLSQATYGSSYEQISMVKGHLLHSLSRGKGVHVAVIDAGFNNSINLPTFDSLKSRDGILGTYDFVSPGNNIYNEHYHGNAVLSIMAGNTPGYLIGSAPEASYWLLRSEDVETEYPVEEDYWIVAAEFADSVGCDVINTSLGYSLFDESQFDHSYNDFTGKHLRISQAANLAVDKGIVVVCSAGNSGGSSDPWGHIVAPAEAEKVLAVAAVDVNNQIAGFSSPGFEGDNFLKKPDVSAMGVGVTYASTNGNYVTGNGTSFSSPIIAGMAACLISYFPEYTSSEIIELIKTYGDRYPEHSLSYGYGIPDFSKADMVLSSDKLSASSVPLVVPNPFNNHITIANKGDFARFELFDHTGRILFSQELSDRLNEISPMKLSNLKKGVYFAVFKGEGGTYSQKLIKY